jgi:tetratricopeptide (TPR) repeat protein
VDRLRPLWDFDDLDATEARLRAELSAESEGSRRAELLTQLARVEGLRGSFDAADALLAEAETLAGGSTVARARIDLERGRRLRSAGDPAAALPLFAAAVEAALAAGEEFVACDAAHMAALAAPDDAGMLAWSERALELARLPGAAYWQGPLLNNLGWTHCDAGRYDEALAAFSEALAAREREPERPREIEIARYAVATALRALDRPAEAAGLLERAVAWSEASGAPDGYFRAELAECYADLGRVEEAAGQARLALPLLEAGGASAEQLSRARELAGA